MPYGVELTKLDTVNVDDIKIAVYPTVMRMFDLKPGQKVDNDTAQKIVEENERLLLAK